MKTQDRLLRYWKNRNIKLTENSPHVYLCSKDIIKRSEYLLDLLKETNISNQSKILELGCNCGRNLNHLYANGYTNLTGIEISPGAIDYMKKKLPFLHDNINIVLGSIEDSITIYKDNEFDLVFSMAVLEHIHPDGEWVFKEIARISKNLLTIELEGDELEGNSCYRIFLRRYRDIFEKYKMQESFNKDCRNSNIDRPMLAYTARFFTKK